ncbi:MAG: hypothetical protein JNL80_14950 [Phycisphaerae bacterium]|jgi:hypothetical protein|nr:hypothetical protein [Phycisphaerae bacterium]
MRTRSHRQWIHLFVLSVWAVAASAFAVDRVGGVPPSLAPFDVYRLLHREGVAMPACWTSIEAALLSHAERVEREVEPAVQSLAAATGGQYWFNWPGLKREVNRRLRDAATDASRAADRSAFEDLAARLPNYAEAITRAAIAWERTTTPYTTHLPHRALVDLASLVEAADMTVEERSRLDEPLARWLAEDVKHRRSLVTAYRATLDRFERGLEAMGIEPERDYETRVEWMPNAWELWGSSVPSLVTVLDAAVRNQERAIDEITTRIGGEKGDLLHRAALEQSIGVWRVEGAPPPAAEFAMLLASPECSSDERDRIGSARRAWLVKELPLLKRAYATARDGRVPYWPLLGSGWQEPIEANAMELDIRLIDQERLANDAVARKEIEKVVGERLKALLTSGRDRLNKGGVEKAPERWDPSPFFLPRDPSHDRERLAMDPGPISEPAAQRIASSVGLNDETLAWWAAVTTSLRSEVVTRVIAVKERPDAPGVERNAWEFTPDDGYRFNMGVALELSNAARSQIEFLSSREEALFDELDRRLGGQTLASRIERRLRAIHRDQAVIAREPRSSGDRRDLVEVERLIRIAMDSGERDDLTLTALAAALELLGTACRERANALGDAISRERLLVLRAMWTRDEAGEAIQRERAVVARELDASDAGFRDRIAAAIRTAADAAIASSPNRRAEIEDLWRYEAFPNVFGSVPPVVAALARAQRSAHLTGDADRIAMIDRIAARWREQDEPVVQGLIANAIAMSTLGPSRLAELPALERERERLGNRRRFLSELMLVALRVLGEAPPHSDASPT